MPFTLTHTLAVLPIFYIFQRLLLLPLIIGAVIPDFTLFFPISNYTFAHSLPGLIAYCWPMGIVVYLLFVYFGKGFLVDISPSWVYGRVASYRDVHTPYTAINVLIISVSIVIGAATHSLWDAFSHSFGWGPKVFPALHHVVSIFGIGLPWYKIVQYGSSIVGLPILLLYALLAIWRLPPQVIDCRKNYKLVLCAVIVSFMAIPVVILGFKWQVGFSLYYLVRYTVVDSLSVSIVLFFGLSLVNWLIRTVR